MILLAEKIVSGKRFDGEVKWYRSCGPSCWLASSLGAVCARMLEKGLGTGGLLGEYFLVALFTPEISLLPGKRDEPYCADRPSSRDQSLTLRG